MSNGRRMMEELLGSEESVPDVITEYAGREIEFFEERGRKYTDVLRFFFWAISSRKFKTVVGKAARGCSKTMTAADASLTRFMFDEDDVLSLGGSLEQAKRAMKYVSQILRHDHEVSDSLMENLKTMATGRRGNWFAIAASSMKQVRGGHPGDAHPEMGWENHGGLLVLDERDEMDDDIADAAEFSMGDANPATVLITSTAHREDGSGIAQIEEDATALGLFSVSGAEVNGRLEEVMTEALKHDGVFVTWDVLDICERCTHDCTACPGGSAFAGPLLGSKPSRLKDPFALPTATAESVADWENYKKANGWPADEPPYCAGRAKQHDEGFMKMANIFYLFKRARNKEVYEVEMLCRRRRGARNVCDPAKVDATLTPNAKYIAGYETIGIIDWGFKGWCAVGAIQAQGNNTYVLVDVRMLHLATEDTVYALLEDWREEYGIHEVFPDSSHPYQNKGLEDRGFVVTPVVFNTDKEFGAGWVAGIVQRGQLKIPGEIRRGKDHNGGRSFDYVYPSEDLRLVHKQLKGWKRDKNGKIVKKDDHACDMLLCAAKKFGIEEPWSVEGRGVGRRESML